MRMILKGIVRLSLLVCIVSTTLGQAPRRFGDVENIGKRMITGQDSGPSDTLSIENEIIEEDRISPMDNFSPISPIPEMESERHEMERALVSALNQLEVNQRAIVVLVDLQELNYEEAAHVLGIPVGTVKSRLSRARLQLQRILGNSRDVY